MIVNTIIPCSITDGVQCDDGHGTGLPYHPMEYDDHGYLYEVFWTLGGYTVLRHSHNKESDVLERYFKTLPDAVEFINTNPEDGTND